ncbi:MAG TPA: glucoamylase family protein [Puia sp.]|nr:glucoamylase family protein [Puia sp.]
MKAKSRSITNEAFVARYSNELFRGQYHNTIAKQFQSAAQALFDVRCVLSALDENNQPGSAIAEWLLDNFYVIEEQIRKIAFALTRPSTAKLPLPARVSGAGLPRIYDIIKTALHQTRDQLTLSSITGYIDAYQSASCLQSDELAAVSFIAPLVLLERLGQIAVRIALINIQRFPDVTDVQQLEDRIAYRSLINSLRILGSTDWREFLGHTRTVEKILTADPAGVYHLMDFPSRDMYCRVVARIATRSPHTEQEIAAMAIDLAAAAAHVTSATPPATPAVTSAHAAHTTPAAAHVGYYLTGNGRSLLEQAAAMHPTPLEALRSRVRSRPLWFYLGGAFIVTSLIECALFLFVLRNMHAPVWLISTAMLLVFPCISQLSLNWINRLTTSLIPPTRFARLDFSEGVPASSRTLVVIPALIGGTTEVETLVDALEVRFLANRTDNLHFALLTDFKDAKAETLPEDVSLLEYAAQKITDLNIRYGSPQLELFFLFHRPRRWNPAEGAWIGYERKRGKLSDLNALLRGKASTGQFSLVIAKREIFPSIKYIITLDADTQLPPMTAWKLVGAISHPLYKGVYREAENRVVSGYGMLQPRMGVNIHEKNRTRYIRMQGAIGGVDPYTLSTPDVYQDLFDEGSFIGKGIYDVDIYDKMLLGRFPENSILSHDLIEGCYMRSGLVTDVQLFEEYPITYDADTRRHHRWIRGDWQLLPYLISSDLSLLSRWKMTDNLRRSLVPFATMVSLLLGWFFMPKPGLWTAVVLGIVLFPTIDIIIRSILTKPSRLVSLPYWQDRLPGIACSILQSSYAIINLPFEAYYTMDAIIRTGWRMLISRCNMLEWNPSGEARHAQANTLYAVFIGMWICPFSAAAITAILASSHSGSFPLAWPFLLLWLIAPAITWWMSLPPKIARIALPPGQTEYLRRMARKTWSFFEQFVDATDNWLPPDYYQEFPVRRISHRTSPTNMGLALSANLTACDFGYITVSACLDQIKRSLDAMTRLERYKGHFYNWYDTHSLTPVKPRYVSTVDSGNLAILLLVLRRGLLALRKKKIFEPVWFNGLADTFHLVKEHAPDSPAIRRFASRLGKLTNEPPQTLTAVRDCLGSLVRLAKDIVGARGLTGQDNEGRRWALALLRQNQDALDELTSLAPLISAVDPRPGGPPFTDPVPAWEELAACNGTTPANQKGAQAAAEKLALLEEIAAQCQEFSDLDFDFLYNSQLQLLSIGFNIEKMAPDKGCYDLLASEARMATFLGIAQGKIPRDSWFALGRPVVKDTNNYALLSWSGSMFEYLMPLLVMPAYKDTLLDLTYRYVVSRQIAHGKTLSLPWGVSECSYNDIDINLAYQYGPAGVPGLGLQRGLGDNIVIAPYASLLALMVAPSAACDNLQRLSSMGLEGKFGFYDSIDFTPARRHNNRSGEIVRSFMIHHQGMGFLSLAEALLDRPMQTRFEREPLFKTSLMLLQEKIDRKSAFKIARGNIKNKPAPGKIQNDYVEKATRSFTDIHTAHPEVQLLSNGRYHVMVTNAGGGYSKWKDLALTRWRPDGTRDSQGAFVYIRDLSANTCWSCTHQPTRITPDACKVTFSPGQAAFYRKDGEVSTVMTIAVSPEDDVEMRRIILTNNGTTERLLEITSYTEVVLTSQLEDEWNPIFSNLFIETEIVRELNAIFAHRRPRPAIKHLPWLFHFMQPYGAQVRSVSYETDRAKFIGRHHSAADPQAMQLSSGLTETQGAVLDPILAIRCLIELPPGGQASIDLAFGVGKDRQACESLTGKYRDLAQADKIFTLAATYSQAIFTKTRTTGSDIRLSDSLAAAILYPSKPWREGGLTISTSLKQAALLNYGISGGLPVILLDLSDPAHMDLVGQLVHAHYYWQLQGLDNDLVICNASEGSYHSFLQACILEAVGSDASGSADSPGHAGRIFTVDAAQLPREDHALLKAIARVIISDAQGAFAAQVDRHAAHPETIPPFKATRLYVPKPTPALPLPDLLFPNGHGGFSPDGKEYLIFTAPDRVTPMPWSNVLANPRFGTVISESGQGYTWMQNSLEFRLTPFTGDPLADISGEAFYLRDEEDGHFWSPAPLPASASTGYLTRHGFGYSVFECNEHGVHSEMWVYTDMEASVKYTLIKLLSDHDRSLSVTGYIQWALGNLGSTTAPQIVTAADRQNGTLLARNPYSDEFSGIVCFFDTNATERKYTADRKEFIGRNGSLQRPEALFRATLTGNVGAGFDACAAIRTPVTLRKGVASEIVFLLGAAEDIAEASRLAIRCRALSHALGALQKVRQHWRNILGAIRIDTPDPAVDILSNGWLLYQTLSSRLWGRSSYSQPAGCLGFRDLLQDASSILHPLDEMTRCNILLAASRQFVKGDVLHWWHPPGGKGLRTRCSDDALWLPYVTCRYVRQTGDFGILDELIPFLEGGPLGREEESCYGFFESSSFKASLYEHCKRAIDHGLRLGDHGLPLIGTGDWNDCIERVETAAETESFWVAFFLYNVLMSFSGLASSFNDPAFSAFCLKEAKKLRSAIDQHGWNGFFYRRLYPANPGPSPLTNSIEDPIDSPCQSWAVLSEATLPARGVTAITAACNHLIREDLSLLKSSHPPFGQTAGIPAFLGSYPPGVNQNGGHLTTAAVWMTMAFAKLGRKDRVAGLLSMINPIYRSDTTEKAALYAAEPYVMPADICTAPGHGGQGGWSWYTASAGWMYQLILDYIFGLVREGDTLRFSPCLPDGWNSASMEYRYLNTIYRISIFNKVTKDNPPEGMTPEVISLVDDGQVHHVNIYPKMTFTYADKTH